MKEATKLFKDFFESEKAGGLILIFCTLVSLTLANSSFSNTYQEFWHWQFANHSLGHWKNDGLMTIFFLLIGLELEREIYLGNYPTSKMLYYPFLEHLGA